MLQPQWIKIPPGPFIYRVRHRIMEGDCQVDHGPLLLQMPGFEMMCCPVTNAQFRAFVDQTGYAPKDPANFLRDPSGDDCPVTWVSLNDANAYAQWAGGRLPTDAEWQYAAGGPDCTRWPWGGDYDKTKLNADGATLELACAHPNGASAWGLLDLCGNAWEWMAGPLGDGHHAFALIRGGSHYRARHFWHIAGGPHPVDSHEKVPLLSEALNRSATVSFRLVREVRP